MTHSPHPDRPDPYEHYPIQYYGREQPPSTDWPGLPPASAAPASPPPIAPQQQPIYVVKQASSSLATISLVLSIIGLLTTCCSFGVLSIAAVITGHVALRETGDGGKEGHGQAVAGLVLGYIGIVPAIFFSVSMVLGGLDRAASQ